MAFSWIRKPAGGVPNVILTEIQQKPSSRVSFVVDEKSLTEACRRIARFTNGLG